MWRGRLLAHLSVSRSSILEEYMKAVVLKAYGDVDQLSYEDVEKPRPGSGEVLVRIAAASLNPIDWKLRSGAMKEFMPLEFPVILGYDLAGEVAELGAGVTSFKVGQRVMAVASKTYAEYAVVKADALTLIPSALSFEQAGALPLVVLTGATLVESGIKPKMGQSVVLSGALGGVGRTAAYVADQHNAQVIAAVRPSQLKEAESLGTRAVVSLEDEEGLAKFVDIDSFADTVGGPVAAKLLKLLRPGAIYATVVGAPPEAANYDIRVEMVQMRPDPVRLAQLAEAFVKGEFKIPIAKVMKLSEAAEAHRLGQAGAGGKIVLVP
jgi:NADPH:quinone reductase-like Zn-dependent oxidoreductase